VYHGGFKAAHIVRTGEWSWWKTFYLKPEFACLKKQRKSVAEAYDKLTVFLIRHSHC